MIFSVITAARFPAPEFENYKLPLMDLATFVPSTINWRIGLLVLFLIISGLAFHRLRSRRAMVTISFLALIVFGFALHACPCPVGMFQNVTDSAVNKEPISVGLLLLFSIPLVCALFWGRLFCSGACPLGAVQEIFHWKTLYIPLPLDRVLRMFPILILVLSTVMAASGSIYPLCYLDPYLPLFLLSFSMPFALLTLAFLVLGLYVSRPFCRYLCPYGALLRLFAIFSATTPRITTKDCINCRLCEQGCPNGAILSPEDKDSTATHERGTRRLSLLVVSIPMALFVGAIIGYTAAPLVTSLHPDVRLLEDVRAKKSTLETQAFETSETPLTTLEVMAFRATNITTVGLSIGGLLFAACIMAELIAVARRKESEETYEIDSGLCFCCGRCYETCPPENNTKGDRT